MNTVFIGNNLFGEGLVERDSEVWRALEGFSSCLLYTSYTLPVFWIVILACVAAFLGWWVYMSVRINHLIKRLDAAGFQYQTTHDEKAYLTELDECAKMPGAEKITLSKMPAKDYLTILKIRTLRELSLIHI